MQGQEEEKNTNHRILQTKYLHTPIGFVTSPPPNTPLFFFLPA